MSGRWGAILAYAVVAILPAAAGAIPGFAGYASSTELLSHFLTYAPAAALLLVSFLGWKLNQARISWLAATLILFHALLRWPDRLLPPGIDHASALASIAIALPLTCAIAFVGREGVLFGARSLWRAAAGVAPPAVLLSLAALAPPRFAALTSWKIDRLGDATELPHLSAVSLLLFLFVAVVVRDMRLKGFLAALGITLLPVLHALNAGIGSGHSPALSSSAFLAASLILLHAMFSMYWQRVYLDELTGIGNRRALDEKLNSLSGPYALAMIDIDHFKSFNDTYGHDEGDNVLRLVGKHLSAHFGESAHRYGGEEFCIVLEGAGAEEAAGRVDLARDALARRRFHIRSVDPRRRGDRGEGKRIAGGGSSGPVQVTMSAGVSASSGGSVSPAEIQKAADRALYRAKEAGRNRVEAG